MTLSRLWCLLRGGHRRYPNLPPPSSWSTIVFTLSRPIVPVSVSFYYEPCMHCGELFLHERVYKDDEEKRQQPSVGIGAMLIKNETSKEKRT